MVGRVHIYRRLRRGFKRRQRVRQRAFLVLMILKNCASNRLSIADSIMTWPYGAKYEGEFQFDRRNGR